MADQSPAPDTVATATGAPANSDAAVQSKLDSANTAAPETPGNSNTAVATVPSRPKRVRPVRFPCVICGRERPARDVTQLDVVRPSLFDRVKADHPDLPAEGYICSDDLDRFRSRYVSELLGEERGELTKLEQEVVQSLADHETLAENIEAEWVGQRSLGERLSDHLASFGGSWTFIIIFFVVLMGWMAFNVVIIEQERFDPYPFILLNLVLSCLAAIQAPIIMMSQKRQEAKDRLRSENDYRVNLKAELEIRHLHEKIDHILTRQWERLAEIQQIQLELMQDPALRKR
jgi:uncharacterized membrane protein